VKKHLVFPLLAFLLFAGCVSKGTYETKAKEVETLSAQSDNLQAQVNSLTAEVAELKRDKEMTQMEKDALQAKVDELQAKMNELSHKAEKAEKLEEATKTYEDLTKKLQNEIQQGKVQITEMKNRLTMTMVDKILFPSGEADITPAGLRVLRRVGNVLKTTQGKIIRVEGHTDDVVISSRLMGRFPTNWELSTARASNVVRFLQDSVGIDPARLQAVGLSQYHPIASNATARGRSQNRRIEIALLPMATGGEP
jgi:chemotaxis protein MotB